MIIVVVRIVNSSIFFGGYFTPDVGLCLLLKAFFRPSPKAAVRAPRPRMPAVWIGSAPATALPAASVNCTPNRRPSTDSSWHWMKDRIMMTSVACPAMRRRRDLAWWWGKDFILQRHRRWDSMRSSGVRIRLLRPGRSKIWLTFLTYYMVCIILDWPKKGERNTKRRVQWRKLRIQPRRYISTLVFFATNLFANLFRCLLQIVLW